MKNLKKIFKNKTVIITGHTGFKGSWLALWMTHLGAKVIGLSINVPTNPSNFVASKIKQKIIDKKCDVRNLKLLKKNVLKYKPDFIFHLAAQSLVKSSYSKPIYTWQTNTLGTLNILESARYLKKKCVLVIITSDKVYKNFEINRGYKENDILGGADPYSASKASAEIAIQSYIKSFYPKNRSSITVGVARAGNVIGGGDWSRDRLVPDCVKSWVKNKRVLIRNPNSTRPWQHVLEAISGYIFLALNLKMNKNLHGQSFNFGPSNNKIYPVVSLVKLVKRFWKNIDWKIININKKNFFESKLLKLNSSKAKKILKWKTILTFEETIEMVSSWYKKYYFDNKKIELFSIEQIKKYEDLLKKRLAKL